MVEPAAVSERLRHTHAGVTTKMSMQMLGDIAWRDKSQYLGMTTLTCTGCEGVHSCLPETRAGDQKVSRIKCTSMRIVRSSFHCKTVFGINEHFAGNIAAKRFVAAR